MEFVDFDAGDRIVGVSSSYLRTAKRIRTYEQRTPATVVQATPDHTRTFQNATFRVQVLNECAVPGEARLLALPTTFLLPESKTREQN